MERSDDSRFRLIHAALVGVILVGVVGVILTKTPAGSSKHPGASKWVRVVAAASPAGTKSYPRTNTATGPLTATQQAQSSTYASESRAYSVAAEEGRVPRSGYATDPGKSELVSYNNSAAGPIQPDGSVKLTYQGIPAWVFTWTLLKPMVYSQGPGPLPGATRGPYDGGFKPGACQWISIVDARDGSFIEAFEECDSWHE